MDLSRTRNKAIAANCGDVDVVVVAAAAAAAGTGAAVLDGTEMSMGLDVHNDWLEELAEWDD